MTIKATIAAAGFAALTAAGIALGGAAAGASDAGPVYTLDNSGKASWVEKGDKLVVCDRFADGWGTRGYIYYPNPRDSANGAVQIKLDDPNTSKGCVTASRDIPEGKRLALKVCNYAGARLVRCWHQVVPDRPY